MTTTNEVTAEKMYRTRMSANSEASSEGRTEGRTEGKKIIEEQHTRSEIISHAVELLAKELAQDLCTFADLDEVITRSNEGEDIISGYVNKAGEIVDFTEDMQFKAAIAVLNLNGHFFEATPID